MATAAGQVYEFKITLKEIKPKIWRRIQVPSSYTFWELHVAVNAAVGWLDCHLHEFNVLNPRTLAKDTIGIPDNEEGFYHQEIISGLEAKIADYFLAPKDKAIYTYDFGDGWTHEILLEKILPIEAGVEYPRCVKGKRACPPENCGGTYGYEELLKVLADPQHPEREEQLNWITGMMALDDTYDPEAFDPTKVYFDDPAECWSLRQSFF